MHKCPGSSHQDINYVVKVCSLFFRLFFRFFRTKNTRKTQVQQRDRSYSPLVISPATGGAERSLPSTLIWISLRGKADNSAGQFAVPHINFIQCGCRTIPVISCTYSPSLESHLACCDKQKP